MPKVSSHTPEVLRPFHNHGVFPEYEEGKKEAICECPMCGREKFSVNVETGLWRCFVCQEGSKGGGGNIYTFMRILHKLSMETTKEADYAAYAKERKLLSSDTPRRWGLALSFTTRQWVCPGYSVDGKLNQLYRYVSHGDSRHWHLTAGVGHFMHGVPLFDANKPTVYIAEGISDGMALWETLQMTRVEGDKYLYTKRKEGSLLSSSSVLAIPGAAVSLDPWASLLADKKVVLLYDNDHPTKNDKGVITEPAGYLATRKGCISLASCDPLPKEVSYLKWWDGDGNHNPKLPKGFDTRDFLATGDCLSQTANQNCPVSTQTERVELLSRLLKKVQPVPSDWLVKMDKKPVVDLQPRPCTDWSVLIAAWKRAMKWTEGLDRALSVMLSCVLSTEVIGDQLWLQVVAPPGAGKTSLADALAVARKYVMAKDVIRGFHSGYKTDKDGSEDTSLIAKLSKKTLITKDGDTLLKSPNLDQILSEARALYDGTTSASYRNNLNREYKDTRMTWILCGTASILKLDSSELGARFLTCIIMDGIDDELEDDVLHRIAGRTLRNMCHLSNGKAESRRDVDMAKAMQLTGGYVIHLREQAEKLLTGMEIADEDTETIINLGKFVAHMRARPSKTQDEASEREFGSRLVSQLLRLTVCLSAVLGQKKVGPEVMRRVMRVGTDTARGRSLELAKFLYAQGNEGAELADISAKLLEDQNKTRILLNFLGRIKVVETFHYRYAKVVKGRKRWRLTERMKSLYEGVFNE